MDLREHIRIIENFPKEGISFKDITTLLKDGTAFQYAIDRLTDQIRTLEPDIIAGPEARGFLLGAPVAYKLGIGFVPVRKPGKLPAQTLNETYALEYGTDSLEAHADAFKPEQRVVLIDDLLATGGTISATANLINRTGAKVVGVGFLIELLLLKGREKLADYPVISLVEYDI